MESTQLGDASAVRSVGQVWVHEDKFWNLEMDRGKKNPNQRSDHPREQGSGSVVTIRFQQSAERQLESCVKKPLSRLVRRGDEGHMGSFQQRFEELQASAVLQFEV